MKKYNNYKDSGIEWIGKIPEHWDIILFKRIILKIKDGTHGTFQRVSNGHPFLSAKNVYDNGIKIGEKESNISEEDYLEITKNGFPSKNDLLITCVGTIGRTYVYDFEKPMAFQRSVTFIRFYDGINPQFYKYYVQSSIYQNLLISLAKTSAQSGIYMGDLMNTTTIKIPPFEQTAIANYLDHKTAQIDTLIAKKEKFISLLQEERTAVINQAVTKGLDPNVPMKDSGIEWLGEIPEHWEVKKLKLLANIQGRIGFKGYTVGDLVSEGEGALTLGAKHIDKFNQLNLSNPEFISWDKYYESPEIMVQIGDIILTQRGTLGKVILIKEDIGKATINPSMVILSKLKANDYFLYYFFNSDYFKSWIDLTNTATAVPMISQGQLGNLKLVLPNNDEQNQIVNSIQKSIKKIDDIIVKAQQEIELLKEYKTALISEVVTGKVDVRDVILN